MSGALLFLLLRSARGRVVRMARRLREPRYLVGFLVGAGWMSLWVGRFLFRGQMVSVQFGIPEQAVTALAGPLGQVAQIAVCLAGTLILVVWWLLPFGRNSFEFAEAELHLLLPAPVPRRHLIQYGILRSQPGLIIGAAIVTFFSGPGTALTVFTRFAGVWLFLTIWDLHAKGRSLWLAKLGELPPAAAWRRRALVWGGLLALAVVLLASAYGLVFEVIAALPPSQEIDAATGTELLEIYGIEAWGGLLGWLLTPMIWLTNPYFLGFRQPQPLAALAAYAFPVAVLLAHNEWVVRSRTRFEEAALAHAKRKSKQVDPASRFWRLSDRSRRWSSFPLGSRGVPEVGLVWCNLMLATRLPMRVQIGTGLAAIVALVAVCALPTTPSWVVGALQILSVVLILVPPLLSGRSLRNDLRANLLKLEVLRPLPAAGWRFFLAQITAPAILVMLQTLAGAALILGLDVLANLGFLGTGGAPRSYAAGLLDAPGWVVTPLVVLSVLPLALATALLSTALENVAALLFPSWVHLGISKKQAASRFGQNIIVFLALSLAMVAGLAPGILFVASVVAVQVGIWGSAVTAWEVPILGLLAAAPTAAVVAALVRLGGGLWDRLDPSQELLSEGS